MPLTEARAPSWPIWIAVAAALAGLTALAQQKPQAPTFRSGIELFHLDVSVLDRDRRPVRGLTAADFTVVEDGQTQKIVALSEIVLPDAEAPPAAWMTEVSPDVVTNHVRERRLVVIVMDDATIGFDQRAIKNARQIGRDVVSRLGPADLAAVVFTQDNRRPQDFTADRARLLAAVERTSYGNRSPYSFLSSIETLWAAAQLLIEVPERRKTLVHISGGVPVDVEEGSTPVLAAPGAVMAGRELQQRMIERTREIFAQAARANVNVYTFDVCGPRAPALKPRPCDAPFSGPDLNVEFLQTVAAGTGGRATVNTHDFTAGVERVFTENSSYYLLGYESAALKPPGSFRRLDVRVNRPGVEVRARNRHYTEKTTQSADRLPDPPATKALAGLLPTSDLPLEVQVAPIAIPGRTDTVAVAATLALRADAVATTDASPARVIDWEMRAFDPEGRPRGVVRQSATLTLRPWTTEFRLELLGRLDVKPGAYQFRFAAHDRSSGKSGSVYADVDVPDFSDEPLALSGILISSATAPAAAPKDALSALVPVIPTAGRQFAANDRVSAFTRVYQRSGRRPARPVTLLIQVRGMDDRPIDQQSVQLDASRFEDGAADVGFSLPLQRLPPGPYLLTVEAALDENARVRRDVRFRVK